MAHLIDVIDTNDHPDRITVDRLPDRCPLRHMGIQPSLRLGFLHDEESWDTRQGQVVLQCPRNECRLFFVAYYGAVIIPHMWGGNPPYELRALRPYSFVRKEFGESIQTLSSSFCGIFNQAAEAEVRGLRDVAGPGYRKALSF